MYIDPINCKIDKFNLNNKNIYTITAHRIHNDKNYVIHLFKNKDIDEFLKIDKSVIFNFLKRNFKYNSYYASHLLVINPKSYNNKKFSGIFDNFLKHCNRLTLIDTQTILKFLEKEKYSYNHNTKLFVLLEKAIINKYPEELHNYIIHYNLTGYLYNNLEHNKLNLNIINKLEKQIKDLSIKINDNNRENKKLKSLIGHQNEVISGLKNSNHDVRQAIKYAKHPIKTTLGLK